MAMVPADDASASEARKSKQERIRDNQRRSRARRQEHLSDLEKRLDDCHTLCRDAELQREALKTLQIENARLRELLTYAGVNTAFIDNYVNHGAEAGDTVFRQLRPKLALPNGTVASTPTNSLLQANKGSQSCGRSNSCQSSTIDQSTESEEGASDERYGRLPHEDAIHRHLLLRTGLPGQNVGANLPRRPPEFCCDSFQVPPNGPLRDTTDDTILCSVARELIEQYCVNAEEMEIIKARLATGFSRPAMPNQGCRVNNQLLFEVLNDIGSKWS